MAITSEVKRIQAAVRSGQVDQMSTREVADGFGCALATARRALHQMKGAKRNGAVFDCGVDNGKSAAQVYDLIWFWR